MNPWEEFQEQVGPWADFQTEEEQKEERNTRVDPVGDYRSMVRESTALMGEGVDQIGRGGLRDIAVGAGKTALGGLGYITSPINAALRTTIGKPLEALAGIPREYSEFAAGMALPFPKRLPTAAMKGVAKAPTKEELFQSADEHYRAAREAEIAVAPDLTEMLQGKIKSNLQEAGYRDYAPGIAPVYRALDELPTNRYGDVSDFDAVRQVLQRIGADRTASDAVRRSVKEIDEFLAPKVPEIGMARGDYAAASRAEDFGEAMEKAGRNAASAHSGQNFDNAVRQQAKALRNNKKAMRGWSDEEKEQLDKIISGSFSGNAARFLSNLLGGKGGAWGGISAYATLGAAPAAGYGLKKLGDALTSAKAAKLDEMLRGRSPLSRQLEGPIEDFGKAAQEAEISPTARNLSRLMIASRNLSHNLKDADVNIAPNEILKSLFGQNPARSEDE